MLFAGLTPGLVGLAQFNIQLRADTPTGSPTLPLSIRIGDLTTGVSKSFHWAVTSRASAVRRPVATMPGWK